MRLRYLVDSNVWLEALLKQERSAEAQQFLRAAAGSDLALTDFAAFSIGLRLIRLRRTELYQSFIDDVLTTQGVRIFRLEASMLHEVCNTLGRLPLDFDDAYQYVAAEAYDLQIVSFDADFDKTPRGRVEPAQAMKS